MSEHRPVELERLRHVAGEMLLSRDFRDQAGYDGDLLAWHQRAVHDAYGIVGGLACTLLSGHVEVAPGLAYDRTGRALQVVEPRRIARPRIAGRTMLLLRAACGGGTELAWVDPRARAVRAGVPLTTLVPAPTPAPPGVAALQPAPPAPATVRVLKRPRIGSGTTPADGTPWEPWTLLVPGRRRFGVQVRVDTSAVGFTERPCYFAWLVWPDVASAAVPPGVYVDLTMQYVEDEAVDGFMFRVVLRPRALLKRLRADDGAVAIARAQRLHVAWFGVQVEAGGTR